jgi:hypothetical protein
MRRTRLLAIAIMLSAIPVVAAATQKPKNSGKVAYSHAAGKGTAASVSHHKDNSALILRENTHSGVAADLSRVELQSLHSPAAVPKQPRVRTAVVPRISAGNGNRSVPINFSGHAPAHSLATTKSTSKAPGASAPKRH